MSRQCYTYFLHWTKTNKSYYGVRYARKCNPDDLWKSYFTSSKFVLSQRQMYGEPDVIQIRKLFGNNSTKAKLWEEKVLRRMNVIHNDVWLNQTNNNSFRGQDCSWNEGLTKYSCPSLLKASQNISKSKKGLLASDQAKVNMKKSANKRKHINSWNQLKQNSDLYDKFQTYEEFIKKVNENYDSCWGIASIIAKKICVTRSGVITAMKHQNLSFITDQKIAKVYSNYSDKFASYYDYAIKIILFHNHGYTPSQISTAIKINEWGIESLLKSIDIVPNKCKSGPSTTEFKKNLNELANNIMNVTYSISNNPLSCSIIKKLKYTVENN